MSKPIDLCPKTNMSSEDAAMIYHMSHSSKFQQLEKPCKRGAKTTLSGISGLAQLH